MVAATNIATSAFMSIPLVFHLRAILPEAWEDLCPALQPVTNGYDRRPVSGASGSPKARTRRSGGAEGASRGASMDRTGGTSLAPKSRATVHGRRHAVRQRSAGRGRAK